MASCKLARLFFIFNQRLRFSFFHNKRDGADLNALRWKHFLFTFKNTVFECIARDYGCEQIEEDDDTVRLMSRRLYK